MLSPRQELILRKVVESYLAGGAPTPSKQLAGDPDVNCSASTVRSELAVLEEHGLLAHPHTSAGRVPTDAGHRYFVDRMLASGLATAPRGGLELSLLRREVDAAMRVTTETLSQVTNLLALVSAPSLSSATIRHIEVLAPQPQVVMIVVISSTGGVSKVLCTFGAPVDTGLIGWAGEYLNERLRGLTLGARMLGQRIADPTLPATERAFVQRIAQALGELGGEGEMMLYVDGAARLLSAHRPEDLSQINALMDALERRVSLLAVLRAALNEPDVYVRIGHENQLPALQSLTLVAAGYGLPWRKLGTVSLIGPVRMDYGKAIATVRDAAVELSRFVEDVYAER